MSNGGANYIASFEVTSVTPVKFLSFSAAKNNNAALLQWQTATEENTRSFSILRSADGINFQEIGEVMATGNSLNVVNYSYRDKQPNAGANYYRITATDFDGKITHTETIRLVMDQLTTGKLIYAKGNSTLRFSGFPTGAAVVITGINGQTLISGRLGTDQLFDISRLSYGLFAVTLIHNDNKDL